MEEWCQRTLQSLTLACLGCFAFCDVGGTGEVRTGAQEHFYLETNACVVIPSETNELVIWSSTQNVMKTQMQVAHCLGIDASRVVAKVPAGDCCFAACCV